MKTRDIIVAGASAGGVPALQNFVKGLPKDLKASIFIVLHIPPYSESYLPDILSKAGPLEAVHPEDGEAIKEGKIYVAPNDRHMLLEDGNVIVKRGPKENRFRPAIDALFRSAAYVYGSRVIGIVFSGLLNDGTSGLWSIKRMQGIAIVQDPDDAEQPQMPKNALEYVEVDYVAPAADMGPLVAGLVRQKAPERNKFDEDELKLLKTEVVIATRDDAFDLGIMDMGVLTAFTCPECHGALVSLVEGNLIRYRCHTGHAYTASSLLAEVSESTEDLLWQAMRAMEEMVMLTGKIADQYEKMHKGGDVDMFREKARVAGERARVIHDSVFSQEQFSEDLRLSRGKKLH